MNKNKLKSLSSIKIDEIHLNDLHHLLKNNGFPDQTTIIFDDANYIIQQLQKKEHSPKAFLKLQQKILYDKTILIDKESFISFFVKCGYKIIDIKKEGSQFLAKIKKCYDCNFSKFKDLKNPDNNRLILEKSEPNKDREKNWLSFSKTKPKICDIFNIGTQFNSNKNPCNVHGYFLDIKDSHNLEDSKFTIIRAMNVLENFDINEVEKILKELSRILHKYGELYIAVPDARIIFNEILDDFKNIDFDLEQINPLLTQIYGKGYENSKTDSVNRNKILFNYDLLNHLLYQAGFENTTCISENEDFDVLWNDNSRRNKYTLLIKARKKIPHHVVSKPNAFFLEKKIKELNKNEIPPLSVIIPIRNEEKILPKFLNSLFSSNNNIEGLSKEYIFVINGTIDNSLQIVSDYIKEKNIKNAFCITSKPGMLEAFIEGMNQSTLKGYIAKIDADCLLEPNTLDLMYLHLNTNKNLQITYAEPCPIGKKTTFNFLQYNQKIRSKRLHTHGRTSMYKTNPLLYFDIEAVKASKVFVDDIVFSYCYSLFFGLNSIEAAKGAFVHYVPVTTQEDFQKKTSRTMLEIQRLEQSYPYFKFLKDLLQRKIICNIDNSEQKNLLKKLHLMSEKKLLSVTQNLEEMSEYDFFRLQSTKEMS